MRYSKSKYIIDDIAKIKTIINNMKKEKQENTDMDYLNKNVSSVYKVAYLPLFSQIVLNYIRSNATHSMEEVDTSIKQYHIEFVADEIVSLHKVFITNPSKFEKGFKTNIKSDLRLLKELEYHDIEYIEF